MSSYLFIAGGFVDSLVEKTKNVFAMDLDPLHYAAMRFPARQGVYYDAFPAKKTSEDQSSYEQKISPKGHQFARINRTSLMHTREGITRNRTGGFTFGAKWSRYSSRH
jgi:hypothetical protein